MGARLPSSDSGDIDGGDFDAGDHCSTEVVKKPLNVWHPSFLPVEKQVGLTRVTEQGKRESERALQMARDMCAAAKTTARATRKPVMLTCWKDTPQLYRRMVVAAAGLSADVANKIDRDLSETEKVMIRSAVTDMRNHMNMLVSL